MGAPKLSFQPDEILFLKQNFYKLTNKQLREHINKFRAAKNQLSCHAFRERCYRMGLQRGIQIRWNKADTKKLRSWYKIMGNMQIAELLNLYGTSSRKINGKIVMRIFNKKHIEKKLRLLGLKRLKEQIKNIRNDHRLCGNIRDITSNDNLWTRGILIAAKEGETRVWNGRRVIKTAGKFIPYTRWFYEKCLGPVPDDMIVFHIDMDSLNDDLFNLEVRRKRRLGIYDYRSALMLIEKRLQKEQEKASNNWKIFLTQERAFVMKEINRLTKIKNNIEKKLVIKNKPGTKYYEPIEAF